MTSRRGTIVTATLLAVLAATPARVSAEARAAVAPPAGAISRNVRFVTTIPQVATAISINFIGDTMFVSTVHGLYSFDVSDPRHPVMLGALPMPIWENEDMDVDPARHLAFLSRDPRGFTTPAAPGSAFPYGAVHVIDVSNPRAMRQINVFLVPAGYLLVYGRNSVD